MNAGRANIRVRTMKQERRGRGDYSGDGSEMEGRGLYSGQKAQYKLHQMAIGSSNNSERE